jgi:D-alanine-D-alanine ligase
MRAAAGEKMRRFGNVAVLMGGPSAERDVSLASGAAVAAGLRERGYRVREVALDGRRLRLPAGTAAVFIALHGEFGEDGGVQARLDALGVPYTGSGAAASRLCMDKARTKRVLERHGLPTPAFETLAPGARRSLPLPVVVKPPRQGSSLGVRRVLREAQWPAARAAARRYDREVLVEAYIAGRELTVGIVDGRVLPAVEIVAPGGDYNYQHKYGGGSRYLVPAPLGRAAARECADIGLRAYRVLGCRGMGRVDLRLDRAGRPFVLEMNTIPGFTANSLLPKAARAAGIGFAELCESVLQAAVCGP